MELNILDKKCLLIGRYDDLKGVVFFLDSFQCSGTVIDDQAPWNSKLPEGFSIERRKFHPDDILGRSLIFLALEDKALVKQIIDLARSSGALVSIPNHPEQSDFQLPVLFKNDELHVTVNYYGNKQKSANLRDHIRELYENGKVVEFEPPAEH